MFARKMLLVSLAVLCSITLSFSELDTPGLSFDSGPTATCNMSGTYTQIKTLNLSSGQYNFSWSPPFPDNKAIYVGYEAVVSGYGWVNSTIYYSFSGISEKSRTIPQIQVGTLGGNLTLVGVQPDGKIAENVNISRSIHAATANETYGSYTWNILGSTDPENRKSFVKLQPVAPEWRFNIGLHGGGSWVWKAWGDPDIQDFSGSDTWDVTGKFACPKCKEVGVPYPAYHKYMSCPASITQNGSTVYCQAGSDVWKCQSHTHDFPSGSTPPAGGGSTPPADNTPNCSGCTSDCSSPCSCTNSGTCGGTATTPPPPSYHACGEHKTSVSGDHSLQASCPSTDSNGNSCTVTNFYACDGHTHSYPSPPPKPKGTTCGACNASYNPNSPSAVNRHRVRTCRFSECRQTWQACVNGWTPPICNKPYRKRNGLTCWAE